MRKNWVVKSLKDLCDDFKKDVVDGPFGSDLKRDDYRSDGIPVLKIQNIKPFKIEIKNMDYVQKSKYLELKRHSYKNGDIIMTKLGAPLGASAIVDNLQDGLIVADLVRIRASKIDTKYLCYHLNSPNTNKYINSQQKGTTRPRVKLSDVRDLPIISPPLPEQRRIVAFIDEAYSAIAKAKENAKKNLQNAHEIFASYLQSIFTNPGDGWEVKKLGDLFDITSSKRVFEADWKKEGVPFYRAREIVKLAQQGFVDNELYISEEMYNRYSTKYGIPVEGDIMITGVGTLGVCYVVQKHDRFYFKDGNIIWLKKKSVANSRFIEYAFKSDFLRRQIDNSIGATVGTYTIIKAKNTLIPIPPIPEQQHIVAILDSLTLETKKLEAIYQKKLNDLDDLKNSILQKAFSGELTEAKS
jgi:type I restriction enzyme S subunit